MPEAYDVQTIHIMWQGHVHQHAAGGALSWGRAPPRPPTSPSAMVEHAARQHRHGRRRDPPPQSDCAGQIPLQHADHVHLRFGEFVRLLDKCVEMADWKGYEKRRKASEKAGRLRGRSVCYYIEFGGIFNDRMDIRFDPGGAVTILGGTHSHGQGHATVFAQLVHDFPRRAFRVDPLRARRHRAGAVRARHLRGAQRGRRRQRRSSRAADVIIEKAKPMAAAMMEADAETSSSRMAPSRSPHRQGCPAGRVAKASYAPMGPMTKFGIGLEGSGSHSPEPPSHPTARTRSRSRSIPKPASRGRPLFHGRRSRPGAEPDDRQRPAAWRCGAGYRAGAL